MARTTVRCGVAAVLLLLAAPVAAQIQGTYPNETMAGGTVSTPGTFQITRLLHTGGLIEVGLLQIEDLAWGIDPEHTKPFYRLEGTGITRANRVALAQSNRIADVEQRGGTLEAGQLSLGGVPNQSGSNYRLYAGSLLVRNDISLSVNSTRFELHGGLLEAHTIEGQGHLVINGGVVRRSTQSMYPWDVLSSHAVQMSIGGGGAVFDTNGIPYTAIQSNLQHNSAGPAQDGGLTKRGAGILELGGDGSFNGPIRLEGGTLTISRDSNLGAPSVGLWFHGGQLGISGNTLSGLGSRTILNPASFDGGFAVHDPAHVLELTTTLNGSGMLRLTGPGRLVLSATNNFFDGYRFDGGSIELNHPNALAGNGLLRFSEGARLRYSLANNTDYSARFSQAPGQTWGIDTNGRNASMGTALAGAGSRLTKSGAGSLSLNALHSYTGGTLVEDGVLILNASSGGVGTIVGTLAVHDAEVQTPVVNAMGYDSGRKLDGVTLTRATLRHTACGDQGWGVTYVLAAGVLESVDGSCPAGNRPVFAFGNHTRVEVPDQQTGSIRGRVQLRADLNPTTVLVVGDGGTLDISAAISSVGGSAGLSKQGPGTLRLTGSNTYIGGTRVEAGLLEVGAGSSTGAGGSVRIDGHATLRVLNSGSLGSAAVQLVISSGGTLDVTAFGSAGLVLPAGSTISNAGQILGVLRIAGADVEIAVRGRGVDIASGDDSPDAADGTDLGQIRVGGQGTQDFLIHNLGTMPLAVGAVQIDGAHPGDFSVHTAPAASVPGGSSTVLTLRFSPSDFGVRQARVRIANSDADENPYVFAVRGTGIAQPFLIVRTLLGQEIADGDTTPSVEENSEFGVTPLNSTEERSYQLFNGGSATLQFGPMTVDSPAGSNFHVFATPGTELQPGETRNVSVRFRPSERGLFNSTVRIAHDSNGTQGSYTFAIRGTGIGSRLEVRGNGVVIADDDTTPSVEDGTDFGEVVDNDGHVERSFVLRNTGNAVLNILSTSFGSNPGEFTLLEAPSGALDPDATATVRVRFDPTSVGTRQIAVVVLTDEPGNSTFFWTLAGTGLGHPGITVVGNNQLISAGDTTPDLADHTRFGTGLVGGPAVERSFRIFSLGTGPLVLNAITLEGAQAAAFTVQHTLPASLPAGQPLTFTVRFQPTAVQDYSAVLRIDHDDATTQQPFRFAIAGTGTLAAAGDLDPLQIAYTGDSLNAIVVRPDGRIVLGGAFTEVLGQPRQNLAQLLPDGTLDPSFDPRPDGRVDALVLQPDGQLLAMGRFTSLTPAGGPVVVRQGMVRLRADGTADPALDLPSTGAPQGATLLPDGRILAWPFQTVRAPGATTAQPWPLVRLHPDGSVDTDFHPVFEGGTVNSVLALPDGRLVIGGSFSAVREAPDAPSVPRRNLVRLLLDGRIDTTFDPSPEQRVTAIDLDSAGRLLIAGTFLRLQPGGPGVGTVIERRGLARVLDDGQIDPGFNVAAVGTPLRLLRQADGAVIVSGSLSSAQDGSNSALPRAGLFRIRADDSIDTAFDPRPNHPTVTATALDNEGRVLVIGPFTGMSPNGAGAATPRGGFARLRNDPATHALVRDTDGRVHWQRGGTALAPQHAQLEFSRDSGASWQLMARGIRADGSSGDWQLAGPGPHVEGLLRATGWAASGVVQQTLGVDGAAAPTVDLAISKSNGLNVVGSVMPVDYLLSVRNLGTQAVPGARIVDRIGTASAFTSAGWTCVGQDGGVCAWPAGTGGLDLLADLPPGGGVQVLFSARLREGEENPVSNTATVAPPGHFTDPQPQNNSATDGPDLRVLFRNGFE